MCVRNIFFFFSKKQFFTKKFFFAIFADSFLCIVAKKIKTMENLCAFNKMYNKEQVLQTNFLCNILLLSSLTVFSQKKNYCIILWFL
jgi:hypothetical protein